MKTVLIDADPATTELATLALRSRWPDLEAVSASTVAEGLARLEGRPVDLVLLQPNWPILELVEAIERVRCFTTAPLIVLSYQGNQMELVTALCSGADDYIKLPCNMTELTLRVWAIMRRFGMTMYQQNDPLLRSGELLLNNATHEAFLGPRLIHLTATEFRLLSFLIKNRRSVMTHGTLERNLYEDNTLAQGLVKKYIQRLRQKLGDDARTPRWIAPVHGIGYRFVGSAPTGIDATLSPTCETAPRLSVGSQV